MKRYLAVLTVIAMLLVAAPARGGVVTVFSAVSAASGTSGEINTSGGSQLRVQVCGTTFTGTVTIYQGAVSGALTATKTLTITENSDCSEYYDLRLSTLTRIDYTRTDGELTVFLEWYE